MAPAEKQALRDRILAGPPWSRDDREAILDYCAEDVEALAALLPAMEPAIAATPRASGRRSSGPLHGRCGLHGARRHADRCGAPRSAPGELGGPAAAPDRDVDGAYGVYEDGHFRDCAFLEAMAERRGYAWPRLPLAPRARCRDVPHHGRAPPELEPLRQLRNTLGELRPARSGGRARRPQSDSCSRPSAPRPAATPRASSKFVFGPATWARFLIKPEPGTRSPISTGLAGDRHRRRPLRGRHADRRGAAPAIPISPLPLGASSPRPTRPRPTHGAVRDRMKACVLGIGYGMGEPRWRSGSASPTPKRGCSCSSSTKPIRASPAGGRRTSIRSLIGIPPTTVFGWSLRPNMDTRPTTLKNFPIQSTGAEMLRLACCLGSRARHQYLLPRCMTRC